MPDTTSNIETENIKMHAYIVMLHLVYRKDSTFNEVKDLLSLNVKSGFPQGYIISVLENIVQKINELKDEWDEYIPMINVNVFKEDGTYSPWVCERVFGLAKDKQPTPRVIAEYAARINAYPKWDEVLQVFRKEAFEAS